jgi:hypothetical protein
MTLILSAFKPAGLLSETLYSDGAAFAFKLKVSGLWHTSTLAVTFGGVTKRLSYRDFDAKGTCLLKYPPSKGATVLKARLEVYDDGTKAKYQSGDVTVELLDTVATWPKPHGGLFGWLRGLWSQ